MRNDQEISTFLMAALAQMVNGIVFNFFVTDRNFAEFIRRLKTETKENIPYPAPRLPHCQLQQT